MERNISRTLLLGGHVEDQVAHTVAVAKLVVVPVERVNRVWKILVSGKSCSIQVISWPVAKENILDSLKSSYLIYKIRSYTNSSEVRCAKANGWSVTVTWQRTYKLKLNFLFQFSSMNKHVKTAIKVSLLHFNTLTMKPAWQSGR